MPKITQVEIFQVDLKPKVARSDAIQTFSQQETPMLRLFCDDGSEGTRLSVSGAKSKPSRAASARRRRGAIHRRTRE